MAHLGQLSLAGTAIVAGGISLGAILSAFVQPIPLQAPEPAWKGMLSTQIAASGQDANAAYYGSVPQDLAPPRFAEDISAADAEWLAQAESDAQAELLAADYAPPAEPDAELTDRVVMVPHYRALEDAASAAEPVEATVAVEAAPSDPSVPTQPAPVSPQVRSRTIQVAADS